MCPNIRRKKILPALLTCLISLISAGTLIAQSTTWTSRTSGTSSALSGVIYASNKFVIVGEDGTILTSPNGINWTSRTSGTTRSFRSICYGGGQFVATGSNGTIVTSPDGITWTSRTSGTSSFLSGVAHGNGKFVAVGGTTIVTSTDGITWSSGSYTSNRSEFLQGVMFANGQFLVYGQRGTRLASADATAWSTVGILYEYYGDIYTATYFKGRYYTGGTWGFSEPKLYPQALSSTDFSNWRDETLPAILISEESYHGMATDGHTLIAVTQLGAIDANSEDGQTWKRLRNRNNVPLYGASFGQGLFVAVGGAASGVILTSPQNAVPDAFETWKSLEFTTAELADPAISGPQADPDSDGISNLVEFVHGLSPKSSDTNSDRLPGFRDPSPSAENVEFEWTINKDSIGRVNFSIRYSETLLSDSWQVLAVTPSILESTAQSDTMIATHPSPPQPKCFYRFSYQLVE